MLRLIDDLYRRNEINDKFEVIISIINIKFYM